MSFKALGSVDTLIVEKFDRLVEKYYSTTDQEALDSAAYGICEEIKELRQVLTNLDKKYSEMMVHAEQAASMSQKRGHDLKKSQKQVNELLALNGELKRQLRSKSNRQRYS